MVEEYGCDVRCACFQVWNCGCELGKSTGNDQHELVVVFRLLQPAENVYGDELQWVIGRKAIFLSRHVIFALLVAHSRQLVKVVVYILSSVRPVYLVSQGIIHDGFCRVAG